MMRPLVAIALVASVLLPVAGILGLLEPTETRYAEIAREMRASGDYLTPRLDGIAHFHKPPLVYWITAAGFAVLGANEWGARLPVAFAALALLALTAAMARRRFAPALGAHGRGASAGPGTRVPTLALWVLGSSLLFLGPGRAVSCDPYLAAAVAVFWWRAGSPWALAALGAGFLIKGPVVFVPTVLPVLVIAAWERIAATRGPRDVREHPVLGLLGPARGWIVFALIALPWFVFMMLRVEGLAGYLLGNQLVQRLTTEVHGRDGAWWYFVAVLAGGLAPWTPALIAGLVIAWRDRARRETKLLLAWLVVPLVFFSFSGSKLPGYLLPLLPAAAMIAALGIERGGRWVAWSVAALLAGLAVAGFAFGPAAWTRLAGGVDGAALALPFGVLVALGVLILASAWSLARRPDLAAFTTIAAVSVALVALAPHERHLGSPRPLARMLAEHRVPGEPVVEYQRFNAGLPFHLREHVLLLDVPRELRFERGGVSSLVIREPDLAPLAARGRVWILGPEAPTRNLAARTGLEYAKLGTWSGSALGFLSHP